MSPRPAKPEKKAIWKSSRLYLSLGIGGLFSYWFVKNIRWQEFWTTLGTYEARWLLLALPVYGVTVWLRALRWKVLLAPLGASSVARLAAYILVGYMGNNVTPMRLGEIFRSLLCSRREGIVFSSVLATIVLERILDAAAMLLILALSLVFATSRLSPELSGFLKICFVLGGLGMVVFFAAARYKGLLLRWTEPVLNLTPVKFAAGARHFLETFLGVLGRLKSGQVWVLFSSTVGFWLVEAVFYFLVLWGFPYFREQGLVLCAEMSLLALAVANLMMIIPSPGYVGTFHNGVQQAVAIFGIAATPAQVLAFLLHSVLIVPVTVVGALCLFFYKDLIKDKD